MVRLYKHAYTGGVVKLLLRFELLFFLAIFDKGSLNKFDLIGDTQTRIVIVLLMC